MSPINDLAQRTLTLKRNFSAPLQLVWEAWTQPEHIAKWWGPKGMETKIVKHDFKVGGSWEYAMQMPNGKEFIGSGIYREIEELAKIITSADFKPMTEGVELRMLFEADGEQTNFVFSVVHATVEYCQAQEKMGFMNGWGSVFERLEELLNKG